MIFSGILPGGKEIRLPAPMEAQFDSAEDAPADIFRAVFPLQESCGAFVWLEIKDENGERLFFGIVDAQSETVSGSGHLLRVTSRNLAGLLLDSGPVPTVYRAPCLPVLFRRHLAPYGFTAFLGSSAVFREPLRVVKGMSEWQVLQRFCQTYLHTQPRVRGTVFDASGAPPRGELHLGGEGGLACCKAEVKNRFCSILTELYAPNPATGTYRLAAKAGNAPAGLMRRHCLAKSETDAAALLKKAERRSFSICAELPGLPTAEVGAPAAFRSPLLGDYTGLEIAELCCTLGKDGLRTDYLLRRDSHVAGTAND